MHEERETFNTIDLDMNGSISRKELWENLKNLKGTEDIKQILQKVDVDNSGSIEYSGKLIYKIDILEFMAATLSRDVYSMQGKLERAFKDFDRNESGTIEVDDIMSVLYGEQSMDLDREAWVSLIKEVDKD
jgi:Ca2+-binding EF-hand superfamily protein